MPRTIALVCKTLVITSLLFCTMVTSAKDQNQVKSWFDFLGESETQFQGTEDTDPVPAWFDQTVKLIESDPNAGLREIANFQASNGYADTTAFIAALKIYIGLFLEDANLISEQLALIEPIGLRDRYRYYYEYGHTYLNWREGNFEKAVEWSTKHVNTADRIGDLSLRVQANSWKVVVLIFADQMYDAIQLGKEVQQLANQSNSIHVKLEAYNSLIQIHRNTYEMGKAIETSLKAIELGKQLNNSQQLAVMYYNLGEIQQRIERYEEAIESHLTAIEYATSANDNYTITYAYFSIATIKEKQEKYQEAYNLLTTLVDRYQSEGDTTNEVYTRLDAASVATKLGDIKSAKYWLNSISEEDHKKFIKKYNYDIKKISIEAFLAEYEGKIYDALKLTQQAHEKLKARMNSMIKDRLRQNKVQLERSTTQSELKLLKEQYLALQSKYQYAQSQTRNNSNWFLALTILMIIGFTVSIYILRNKIKQYKNLSGESGLANRSLFIRDLNREINRQSRFDEEFIVALLRVEGAGKGESDKEVFKALITEQLESALRVTDSVANFDNNTFAILFPNTDQPSAKELLERIQSSLTNKLQIDIAIGFTSPKQGTALTPLTDTNILEQAEIALMVALAKLNNSEDSSIEYRAA